MRRECLVLWVSANDLLAEASNDIVNGKVWASQEYSRTAHFVGHLVSSFTPIVCSAAMARVCPFPGVRLGFSPSAQSPTRVIATNPKPDVKKNPNVRAGRRTRVSATSPIHAYNLVYADSIYWSRTACKNRGRSVPKRARPRSPSPSPCTLRGRGGHPDKEL